MWSAGCILAEMLSMQKESEPDPNNRRPLFPGRSSNMSPGRNDGENGYGVVWYGMVWCGVVGSR